ncbi:hypothetical protein ACFQ1M_09000 [Sungkyunkwania multivorans]|uniref:Beta-carotene 15,15'-monooxygenase n=1 Tax=Sungkyunkwania multivorans TaxID=1173618 RepID=A0ABW3CYS1_9FLAO
MNRSLYESGFFIFTHMRAMHVDTLNTFLILLSLILAYMLPFELFLLAYAILGPLHYLTEIQWIQGKKYFVKSKSWKYLIIVFAFTFSIPIVLSLSYFDGIENEWFQFLKYDARTYLNGLLFLALVTALSLVVFKKEKVQLIAIAVGIVIAILLNQFMEYHVVVGIFLPTIIHVFLFTLLFMLYGNLKTHSKTGYLNVVLMLLIPFFILNLSLPDAFYEFSNETKEIFTENSFFVLPTQLSRMLGFSDGSQFFFYDQLMIKIQIFVSFAYTYHYLNWFSKTTVIGWHKQLTTKRSLIILAVWIASMLLYAYDYKLGLALLLFLSVLHVFMEFPLNVISIKGIGQFVYSKFRSG